MSFETPAALWGLLSLALLAIFSLWRQAAARVVVPSVALWKKIPERNPPIRALRRPRWRLELLFQALAIAAAVAALAGPFLRSDRPIPRKIGLVFDTSARFRAGGRIERMRKEARKLRDGPLKNDELTYFAAAPSPGRIGDPAELRPVDAHVDLAPLLAAARQTAEEVVVFSDRPVDGARARLFGGAGGNVGIVGFTAADDEIFARIVNHGEARRVTLTLEAGAGPAEEMLDLPPGISVWSRKGDFVRADEVSLALGTGDGFSLDDRVRATRLAPARAVVTLTGRRSAPLRRVFESIPGVAIRQGAGEARISVGLDAPPGPAALRVFLTSPRERLFPRSVEIRKHPLTRDLEARAEEIGSVGVGALPPEASGGIGLVTADGRTVMALREGELHFSIDMNPEGWPAGPRSFPIFWTNVVDFARNGAASFVAVRTGRPAELPEDVVSVAPVDGGTGTFTPGGGFLAYSVGEFEVRSPGGARRIRANLLDPRESDTAGIERALDWDPADPGGREPLSVPLGGHAAALAVAFLAVAWLLERRPD